MEKHTDDCYIVNWQEGARGSFISDLLCLLLMNDKETIISIKSEQGDAGSISRGRVEYNIYMDHNINYPEKFYSAFLKKDAEIDFMFFTGFPLDTETLIDYNFLNKKYKNWKCVWIVEEPNEFLQVELINFYKKEYITEYCGIQNQYQHFYERHPEVQVNGISHPRDLSAIQFKKFMETYIDTTGGANYLHISQHFDNIYSTLPEEVKNRIFKLNFIDITTNMPKVLELLSTVTGKQITNNVVESYKKYIMCQKLPQKYLEVLYEFNWT